MIIPSIDIMDGKAVQLVGGRRKVLEAGDPVAVAERFAVAGELAVIDLDAALGRGSNAVVIEELARRYPCRIGGGIRSAEDALWWLGHGAEKVILGTAAEPEILSQLPRDRVIAALDGVDGEVVVDTLANAATIERDTDGIVTITGATRDDVAFATGFAHGQDRFFQMDLIRRQSSGELSALLGETMLDYDRRFRLHRFRSL